MITIRGTRGLAKPDPGRIARNRLLRTPCLCKFPFREFQAAKMQEFAEGNAFPLRSPPGNFSKFPQASPSRVKKRSFDAGMSPFREFVLHSAWNSIYIPLFPVKLPLSSFSAVQPGSPTHLRQTNHSHLLNGRFDQALSRQNSCDRPRKRPSIGLSISPFPAESHLRCGSMPFAKAGQRRFSLAFPTQKNPAGHSK